MGASSKARSHLTLLSSLGVAASRASHAGVITAGIAGVVAGALTMAAGEYVSVSSQRDAERAALIREQAELTSDPEGELEELTQIYVSRGVDHDLARQVAVPQYGQIPSGRTPAMSWGSLTPAGPDPCRQGSFPQFPSLWVGCRRCWPSWSLPPRPGSQSWWRWPSSRWRFSAASEPSPAEPVGGAVRCEF